MNEHEVPKEFEEMEEEELEDSYLYEEKEAIKIQEYSEYVKHRKFWSYSLLGILYLLVASNLFITLLVGLHVLDLGVEFLQIVYISFVL